MTAKRPSEGGPKGLQNIFGPWRPDSKSRRPTSPTADGGERQLVGSTVDPRKPAPVESAKCGVRGMSAKCCVRIELIGKRAICWLVVPPKKGSLRFQVQNTINKDCTNKAL